MTSLTIGTRPPAHPQLGSRRAGPGNGPVSSPPLRRTRHCGLATVVTSGQSRSDQLTIRDRSAVLIHTSNSRSIDIGPDTSSANSRDRTHPSPHIQGSQGDRENWVSRTAGDREYHSCKDRQQTYDTSCDETDGGPHLQHGREKSWVGYDSTAKLRPSLSQKGALNSEHCNPGDETRVDSGFIDGSSSSDEDSEEGAHLGHNTCGSSLDRYSPNSLPEGVQLSKRQQKRQRKRARQREAGVVNETQISVREALREENEQLKQQMYCRVCMDAPVGSLLLPCKHTVLCSSCSDRLNNCPLCRSNIAGRVTIYLSGY